MKIVVTGGTGFVGGAVLRALLEAHPGVELVALTRRIPNRSATGVRYAIWDPSAHEMDPEPLESAHALIHLAGEQAVGRRLTAELAQTIHRSRVASTELLVRTIARLNARPQVLVCASAVGYYGAVAGDVQLDESSPAGSDFLARLCVAWEAAAAQAEHHGVRTISARLGIVLGRGGGALEKMAAPIRAFVGGTLGDGKQVVSWIHLEDCARALRFLLENKTLRGPVNVTAPTPVSNKELTRAIAQELGRPALFRVPAFALKTVLGDGAEPLLTGQTAVPTRLLQSGFSFRYPDIESALREALSG